MRASIQGGEYKTLHPPPVTSLAYLLYCFGVPVLFIEVETLFTFYLMPPTFIVEDSGKRHPHCIQRQN